MDHHPTVDAYLSAMRRGAEAADDMFALFTPDAIYEEPFSGLAEPAVGIDAIRARLSTGWETPLPDFELVVDAISVTGATARAEWTCHSSAFPGPVRGEDHYRFADDGRIERLAVQITDHPSR